MFLISEGFVSGGGEGYIFRGVGSFSIHFLIMKCKISKFQKIVVAASF